MRRQVFTDFLAAQKNQNQSTSISPSLSASISTSSSWLQDPRLKLPTLSLRPFTARIFDIKPSLKEEWGTFTWPNSPDPDLIRDVEEREGVGLARRRGSSSSSG